jgi:signal-transduction protein with cAMP-binding, CBS, and nucleotidyltransferase domain
VPATEVVALVNEVNLDLHRRVPARCLAARPGPPPVPFTLLVMGSMGRGESLLRPDQDNGLVLGDYAEPERGRVEAWFAAFADALAEGLAAAGFPLCTGGVMARNPQWRGRPSDWEAMFARWARQREGEALLLADIAFDFRAVAGVGADAAAAATALRGALGRVVAATPALLPALARQDSVLRVGLGFWGGFADNEPGPGTRTDLKLHGLMPLVAAARLATLQRPGGAAMAETGTPARLAALVAAGALTEAEGAGLREAFGTVLGALLRQQLEDAEAGLPSGNLVDTATLTRAERTRLRDALRLIRGFASNIFAGVTGAVW